MVQVWNGSSIIRKLIGDYMGRYTAEQTHRIMSAVKSKDTKPEKLLRQALWKHNFRYRTNYKKLPGKPDVVFTKAKIAVFCDGDFWHGHNWALRGMASLEEELSNYSEFWKAKILRNVKRDSDITQILEERGWRVIRFWESDIKKDVEKCVEIVNLAYKERTK